MTTWKKFNKTEPTPKINTFYLLHECGTSGLILMRRALKGEYEAASRYHGPFRKWSDAAAAQEKLGGSAFGWVITEIKADVKSESFSEPEEAETFTRF